MPGPYKPKKDRGGNSGILRHRWRTRRRKRDLDQIDGDLQPENAEKLLKQEVDIDQTGDAQFYCLHCARYFIDDDSMKSHFRTKVHKRRLKALELEPYTIEDSERAAGHGSYIPPMKRKIQTQLPIQEKDIIKTDDDFEMR